MAMLTQVDFYDSGRIVSSVCHGPIALTHVKLSSGDWLLKSKKVNLNCSNPRQ